jgi:hypothetical protein
MEYGKVLRRAWQITRQWKVLWVLGFVAGLGRGSGGLKDIINPLGWPGWNALPEAAEATNDIGAGAACGMIEIEGALWVVSTIACGALIAGAWQVEDEGSTSFGWAWQVAAPRYWRLVGITILTAVPLIVMGLIAGAVRVSACVGVMAAVVVWLVWLIQVYAQRAAILEGLGWIEAFWRGWQVLKANVGPTLLFGLIFLVIGTIVGEVAAALVRSISAAIILTDDLATLLGIVLGALIGSVVNASTSVTWTLAYREVAAGRASTPRSGLGPRKLHKMRERSKGHLAAQVAVFEAGY